MLQSVKSFTFFIVLLVFFVSCKKQTHTLQKITAKTTTIDSSFSSNSEISTLIEPYKETMITEINKVLSYTPKNLVRTDGNMQSSLGNLIADLCFKKADSIFYTQTNKHADFSMFNYGGIRSGIYKGNVTNGHVFKLMPFENTLVIVELSADKILELATYFKENKQAHPLSKQIQITLTEQDYSILINEKKINSDKTYFVVTSNYLQNGGDNMTFFKNPVTLYETNYLVRDAIKTYFKQQDTLKSSLDNRIIFK